jgi:hypothetical protein
LKSKDLRQQVEEDEENKVDGELDQLRQFRKYGKIDKTKLTENSQTNNLAGSKKTETENIDEAIAKERQSKQYMQFKKELEKRR